MLLTSFFTLFLNRLAREFSLKCLVPRARIYHQNNVYLVLSGMHITDAGLKALNSLENLQSLEFAEVPANGEGYRELTALKNLQLLNLRLSGLTDEGMKALASLKSLQTLYLGETKITDVGVKELAAMKNLRTIALSHYGHLLSQNRMNVSDISMRALVKLKNLQTLKLSRTKVTDVGVKELASIQNLQILDLSLNALTDKSVKALVLLKNLQKLDLRGTSVTDEGFKELRAALPKCEILNGWHPGMGRDKKLRRLRGDGVRLATSRLTLGHHYRFWYIPHAIFRISCRSSLSLARYRLKGQEILQRIKLQWTPIIGPPVKLYWRNQKNNSALKSLNKTTAKGKYVKGYSDRCRPNPR